MLLSSISGLAGAVQLRGRQRLPGRFCHVSLIAGSTGLLHQLRPWLKNEYLDVKDMLSRVFTFAGAAAAPLPTKPLSTASSAPARCSKSISSIQNDTDQVVAAIMPRHPVHPPLEPLHDFTALIPAAAVECENVMRQSGWSGE